MKASAFVNQFSSFSFSSPNLPQLRRVNDEKWGDDEKCTASTKGSEPHALLAHLCILKKTKGGWDFQRTIRRKPF